MSAIVHLLLFIVGPVLGYFMLVVDFAEGSELFPDEAIQFGLVWGLMLGVGVLLSGVSLHWTLWARAPAFIRYYTASWAILFVLFLVPVGFIMVMAAGAHPPGFVMFIGGMLVMPAPICLLAGTLIAFVPGVILAVMRPGSDD
ncbi:MAG: hypothetical protein JRG91_07715 [Deltaproteobacteria bacterium]|nr:hypothetical protein [Deltaproteobacteria bacterium]